MGPQLYRCGNAALDRRADQSDTVASMGPQLYRCGNLQRTTTAPEHLRASMGPQLYRCGNAAAETSLRSGERASMGPQLYRCGNDGKWAKGLQKYVGLQWGRNFIVAETWQKKFLNPTRLQLQWGRNFIVAETAIAVYRHAQRRRASMGPQLYRCGNVIIAGLLYYVITRLQWGRNFIVAETNAHSNRLRHFS